NNPVKALDALVELRNRAPTFLARGAANLETKAHVAYANQLTVARDWVGAVRQLDLALAAAGQNEKLRDRVLRNKAQVLRSAELYTESQEIYGDLVKRYPRDAILHYGL